MIQNVPTSRRTLALVAVTLVFGAGLLALVFWVFRHGSPGDAATPFAPIIQVDSRDLIVQTDPPASPRASDSEESSGSDEVPERVAAPVGSDMEAPLPVVESPLAAMPANAKLQVRSARTGKGIAGATVQIMSLDPPDALELTAGAGGWLPVPAGVGCAYHAWKKGHSGQSKTLDTEPIPKVITLDLIPLATVYGEVNAALYEDATVSIQRLTEPKNEVYGSASVTAIDALGRWRFENLIIQESRTESSSGGDELPPTFRVRLISGSRSRTLAEAAVVRMGDTVHVEDPWFGVGSAQLQFRYPSGEPLANATNLALLRSDGNAPSSELMEFTTDENGDVYFPVLPAGTWDCLAGFISLGEVKVISGGTHEVTLTGFDLITGRLVAEPRLDPPKTMVPGGQLSVTYSGKTQGSSLVRCEADGSFRLDLLPEDSSGTLTVLKPRGLDSFGKAAATSADARSGDRNVILHLQAQ